MNPHRPYALILIAALIGTALYRLALESGHMERVPMPAGAEHAELTRNAMKLNSPTPTTSNGPAFNEMAKFTLEFSLARTRLPESHKASPVLAATSDSTDAAAIALVSDTLTYLADPIAFAQDKSEKLEEVKEFLRLVRHEAETVKSEKFMLDAQALIKDAARREAESAQLTPKQPDSAPRPRRNKLNKTMGTDLGSPKDH